MINSGEWGLLCLFLLRATRCRVLEPAEQILGVLQTQANRLEPVTALVGLQDHLIPDHGIIIADDAKLKLNAQGRWHAGLSTNSIW
jgi:hypothetical protein